MQAATSQSPGVVLIAGCLMTALTRITLADVRHGTMLTLAAYTKDMERVPALAVWTQAARTGKP